MSDAPSTARVVEELKAVKASFVTVASACQAGLRVVDLLLEQYEGPRDPFAGLPVETMGQPPDPDEP